MFKLFTAPVRKLLNFPLFQFAVAIFLILVMQAANEDTILGEGFDALDGLVNSSVSAAAAIFTVKSFTKSFLTFGFMIGYVYLACSFILWLARIATRLLVDFIGRRNILWLRTMVARDRGIEAYRAWLPLERVRPAHIPQQEWEEAYAWPRDNRPPYPPLLQRALRVIAIYLGLFAVIVVLLQFFSPLPALDWLVDTVRRGLRPG